MLWLPSSTHLYARARRARTQRRSGWDQGRLRSPAREGELREGELREGELREGELRGGGGGLMMTRSCRRQRSPHRCEGCSGAEAAETCRSGVLSATASTAISREQDRGGSSMATQPPGK